MDNCNHTNDESWWEYDQKGIPLCRVCDKCIAARLAKYNPAVLTAGQRITLGIQDNDVESYDDVVEEQIDDPDEDL